MLIVFESTVSWEEHGKNGKCDCERIQEHLLEVSLEEAGDPEVLTRLLERAFSWGIVTAKKLRLSNDFFSNHSDPGVSLKIIEARLDRNELGGAL